MYTKEQKAAVRDALAINQGACNGAGVANALHAAYCAWLHTSGTDRANTNPAARLILHQLCWLAGLNYSALMTLEEYDAAIKECEQIAQSVEEPAHA